MPFFVIYCSTMTFLSGIPRPARRAAVASACFCVLALALPACAESAVEPDTPKPQLPPLENPSIGGDGAAGTVTVNTSVTHQTMDGFGTSLVLFNDPHLIGRVASDGALVISAAQQRVIHELLYNPVKGIGLNRLRVSISNPGWQTAPGAPIVTDAPYPGPQATTVLNYITTAQLENPALRTGFSIGRFDSWINKTTPPDVIADYIKSGLDYARSKGHQPDWIAVQNEPSLSTSLIPAETIRDVLVLLKRRLEADGFSTKASAPDDVVDELGAPITGVIMANAEARSFVKALSIHLYGDVTPSAMASLAKQYGLPLWMTEFSDRVGGPETGWASLIHDLIVNFDCAAVDMLAPFLGANSPFNPSASYITLQSTGLAYEGYSLNTSYYQTGHWSKFLTRGSVRVQASSTNADVKVSAFTRNGKRVVVLIHSGDGPVSIAIPSGTFRSFQTQMSGTDRITDKGLFTTAVILPRRSVTTLVET